MSVHGLCILRFPCAIKTWNTAIGIDRNPLKSNDVDNKFSNFFLYFRGKQNKYIFEIESFLWIWNN